MQFKMKTKKDLINFLLVFSALLIVPMVIWFGVQYRTRQKGQAGLGSAQLSLMAASPLPAKVNQPLNVFAFLDTNEKEVAGFDVYLHFDTNLLTFNAVDTTKSGILPICPQIQSYVADSSGNDPNVSGKVILHGTVYNISGFLSPTPPPPPSMIPAQSNCAIGMFTFTPKAAAQGTQLKFYSKVAPAPDPAFNSQVLDKNSVDVLGSIQNLTVPVEVSTQEAQLVLNPTFQSVNPGQIFDVKVLLNTGTHKVVGTDAVLTYDPAYLEVQGEPLAGQYNSQQTFTQYPKLTHDAVAKTITISGLDPQAGGTLNGSNIEVATIKFKALQRPATDKTPVSFAFTINSRNDSNVAESGTNNDVLQSVLNAQYAIGAGPTSTPVPTATATPPVIATATPTTIPSATPTSTPRPTATVTPTPTTVVGPTSTPLPPITTLGLKISLAARSYTGASNATKLSIFVLDQVGVQKFSSTTLLTDINGLVNLSGLSLTPGQTYYLAVKPLGYLQELFSKVIPTTGGTLDFTTNAIRAGDIDASGAVDSIDYTKFRAAVKTVVPTGTDIPGDFDGSGEVNSLDYPAFRSSVGQSDCTFATRASCGH